MQEAQARKRLGIDPNTPLNQQQIQQAFRSQALLHHPDKGNSDPNAFEHILNARDTLLCCLDFQQPNPTQKPEATCQIIDPPPPPPTTFASSHATLQFATALPFSQFEKQIQPSLPSYRQPVQSKQIHLKNPNKAWPNASDVVIETQADLLSVFPDAMLHIVLPEAFQTCHERSNQGPASTAKQNQETCHPQNLISFDQNVSPIIVTISENETKHHSKTCNALAPFPQTDRFVLSIQLDMDLGPSHHLFCIARIPGLPRSLLIEIYAFIEVRPFYKRNGPFFMRPTAPRQQQLTSPHYGYHVFYIDSRLTRTWDVKKGRTLLFNRPPWFDTGFSI